jgi:glycosyltransferase involved in cell wall biosynthesis
MQVLHIITGLGVGGAEAMLLKFLQASAPYVKASVISLTAGGENRPRIEALGVPVFSLDLPQGRIPTFSTIRRLRERVRAVAPDVIQGWMYHGNLAATASAHFAQGAPRVYWNVRQTIYDLRREPRLTRSVIRLCAFLSSGVDAIIYNSGLSRQQHESLGYAKRLSRLIPNGFDLDVWRPDPTARAAVRAEWQIPPDAVVVGQIARFHPMKGHHRLIEAAAQLQTRTAPYFMLAGKGLDAGNTELRGVLSDYALEDRFRLIGERSDIPRVMSALDILVSPSEWGEGFPNILGEAMSAGVPCVATSIGDSAAVVGEEGRIVPPGDVTALAHAIEDLAGLTPQQRRQLGQRARERIRDRFSLDQVTGEYLRLYRGDTA